MSHDQQENVTTMSRAMTQAKGEEAWLSYTLAVDVDQEARGEELEF